VNPVLLDTSGLIAVVNADDQWHGIAEQVWQGLLASGAPLLTTSLILIEIADGLSRVENRGLAIDICDRLRTSPRVETIQVTPQDETRAWELYRQRGDKQWGMTDCVSMIVARDRKVTEVFTSDHHFEQAGLKILLTPQR
jgi:predicted nucleic acid-binding protein